jgi:hypothetical protein
LSHSLLNLPSISFLADLETAAADLTTEQSVEAFLWPIGCELAQRCGFDSLNSATANKIGIVAEVRFGLHESLGK